ncbi:MAG: GNAT family N-acetyltransferase, partial [Nocardioidaceae bacterium]
MRVKQLTSADIPQAAELWQAATDQRRHDLGVEWVGHGASALERAGAFGVGVLEDGAAEDGQLQAIAVALPALADDARSAQPVPGLAHISSVAARPGHWGRGYGGLTVRAVMSHAVRRGYARVQLWTHQSNRGAKRLYEREGFTDIGRRRTDDNGEEIVHYLRELPQPPLVGRRAARML